MENTDSLLNTRLTLIPMYGPQTVDQLLISLNVYVGLWEVCQDWYRQRAYRDENFG